MRRLLMLLGFVVGVVAGGMLYRRSFGRRQERVDIYFDDGSMVSFAEGAAPAEALLTVARRALHAARS